MFIIISPAGNCGGYFLSLRNMKYLLPGFIIFVFLIPFIGVNGLGNIMKQEVPGTPTFSYQAAANKERKIAAAKVHDLFTLKEYPVLLQVMQVGKCATSIVKSFTPSSLFFGVFLMPHLQERMPEDAEHNRMYAHSYRIKLIFPVHYFL